MLSSSYEDNHKNDRPNDRFGFKEFYQVMLGWYEDEEQTTICYDWAVVDKNFEEVYILFYEDRTRFYNSLGPDFDCIFENMKAFIHELMW